MQDTKGGLACLAGEAGEQLPSNDMPGEGPLVVLPPVDMRIAGRHDMQDRPVGAHGESGGSYCGPDEGSSG